MATSFTFNGRLIKLPGVYAEVKSGITNPPVDLPYGGVLILDTTDTGFAGGPGINGTHGTGEDAVHAFDNISDFRRFVRGGQVWDIAAPLFRPFGSGNNGASMIYYVRPCTTVAAQAEMELTNGSYTFAVRHEGLCGNGVLLNNVLTRGFQVVLEKGTINPNKFRFRFKRGTFTGVDTSNLPYDNVPESDTTPDTIAITPEISTLNEFSQWLSKNHEFNNNFVLVTGVNSTGAITPADLLTFGGGLLFSGGTQTYTQADFTDALQTVKNLGYTHILSLEYGTSGMSSLRNYSLLYHIESECKYEKFLVIGGGHDRDEFQASITAAKDYNSDRVILVHGGCLETDRTLGVGFREKSSLHKAAYVLGRTAGLEPQTPPTFKGLGYAGEVHKMLDNEREEALDAGVLTTYYDTEITAFVITQGINTLQQNDVVLNENGTSHLWSLKRIAAQLNKEIEVNMKVQLLGNQSQGPNRNILSKSVITEWVINYLKKKTATQTVDNLIISFQNVQTVVVGDTYKVTYEFEPNFEVNKIFVTGLIIDPNL